MTYTGSLYAEALLENWHDLQRRMVKVMPREYNRALAEQARRRVESRREDVALVGIAVKIAPEHVVVH
jgi:glutamate synthase domain-containing protein 3